MQEDIPYPECRSRGRAFVYLLPCRDDNLFKVGFSRDPLRRWLTFHSRFFDFFDLDRGLLVATDKLSDARSLEQDLLRAFASWHAPAPLLVRDSAGGYREWRRGVLEEAVSFARNRACLEGHACFDPAADWLRAFLVESSGQLHAWTRFMRGIIEYETHNSAGGGRACKYRQVLDNVLAAYASVGLEVHDCGGA